MNMNNKTLLEKYMKNLWNEQTSSPPVELQEEEDAKYHPATDITFLERLDADAITDSERVELLEHLDRCVFCRQEMERLCKCGALFEGNKRNRYTSSNLSTIMKEYARPLVVAACLLIVVGIGGLYLFHSTSPSQVAYNKVRKMLDDDERIFSTMLTESGYRLNGTSTIKALPVMDDHKRDVRAAYEKLLVDYPDDISYRTEFGKYLLFILKEPGLARNELEKSLEMSLKPSELKRVPELHLLLGIAAFEEKNDRLAKKHFQDALDLEPNNQDARLNLAICLYRNDEKANAIEIFKQLRNERIPETLRNRIDAFLDRE